MTPAGLDQLERPAAYRPFGEARVVREDGGSLGPVRFVVHAVPA